MRGISAPISGQLAQLMRPFLNKTEHEALHSEDYRAWIPILKHIPLYTSYGVLYTAVQVCNRRPASHTPGLNNWVEQLVVLPMQMVTNWFVIAQEEVQGQGCPAHVLGGPMGGPGGKPTRLW